jgi:hypothetical protein
MAVPVAQQVLGDGDRGLDQGRLGQAGAARGPAQQGAPPRPPPGRHHHPHLAGRHTGNASGLVGHAAQGGRDQVQDGHRA